MKVISVIDGIRRETDVSELLGDGVDDMTCHGIAYLKALLGERGLELIIGKKGNKA